MMKSGLRKLLYSMGYEIKKQGEVENEEIIAHGVVEEDFRQIYDQARPYTMTTALEMYNLYNSVQHIVANNIAGDIVECGVWRGGSAMVCALTLLALGDNERRLFLYDTYEGMPEAAMQDTTYHDHTATDVRDRLQDGQGKWNFASLEEVRHNILATGFPEERIVFVKGKVEETIPGSLPEQISLLRLDTDFYQSTLHEFEYLYPLLSNQGVLIVDDYDYWQGARQATDEYFAKHGINILLQRMDVGRIGVKT